MDHVTDAQIIELLEGEGPADGEDHLSECPQCRSVRQLWVDRIDALREMSRESLDDSELHQLTVLYRQLGPGAGRVPRWIASLVRSSQSAPEAARGLVSGEIMEYSAGPFNVMLRIGARGSRPTVSVVGQIETNEEDQGIGGTFSLISPAGQERFSDVDQFGEFDLTEVAPGSYRGTWWFGDQIMVLHDVEIGTDDDP